MSATAFVQYMLAQERVETAKERYNHASTALELAYIKRRLAELLSQHEPLAGLCNDEVPERERLYAAAHYAVVGRLP
jgi:hypothetical protein